MFEFNTIIALELGVVVCLAVLPGFLSQLALKEAKGNTIELYGAVGLWLNIFHELAIIFLILFISMRQSGQLGAVGLEVYSSDYVKEQLLGAFFLISIVMLICIIIRKIFGLKKPGEDNERPDWIGALSCKTIPARILFLAYILTASVAEEMVFRGYFILLWGERSGHIIACAIISAIVFVFLHLYQGKKFIIERVLFAVAFSVASVVSGNIVITISMHLWLNLITTAKLWLRESKKKTGQIDAKTTVQKPAGTLAIWLAIVAVSLGLIGIIGLCFENATFTLVAFVLSIVAFAQARKDQKAARRLAVVALVVSSASIFVAVVLPILIIAAGFIMILLLGIFG